MNAKISFLTLSLLATMTLFAETSPLEGPLLAPSETGSIPSLHRVCVKAETIFSNQPVRFFKTMSLAMDALEQIAKTNTAALAECKLQFTNSLNRPIPADPYLAFDCFIAKADIATKMTALFADSLNLDALESVAILVGEARKATISNYTAVQVPMNIMPPSYPGVGNDDEFQALKKAHLNAIMEADRQSFQNGLQEVVLPRIKKEIVPMFKKALQKYAEARSDETKTIDHLATVAKLTSEERKDIHFANGSSP